MQFIKVEDKEHCRNLTLNRPELHNAFNAEMIAEITQSFTDLPREIRLVRMQGEGKSFCAGADLAWMKSMVDYSVEENKEDSLKLFDMFASIRNCRVPVLAKVHGNVFGGGLGLVAASDIVVAEEKTLFCFSEVKLGIAPAVISPFVLEKTIDKSAREWMLTAKRFSAMEAYFGGLVCFTSKEDDIDSYLDKEAARIVSNGKEAVEATKKLIGQLKGFDWDQARRESTQVIAERRVSDEGQEGLRSFLEKRDPSWRVK